MKTVYMAMSAGFVHGGHLNILEKARSLGMVTIGLLTDEAIASYKRLPALDYHEREKIVRNLRGVEKIIPQKSLSYAENLKALKPHYVVHGDDWRVGPQSCIRSQVVEILSEWGGELVEVPYTQGLDSTSLAEAVQNRGITPQLRQKSLKRLMQAKPIVRIMEAHNGLTGLIVEHTIVHQDGKRLEFDGVWESSLTDSTSKGKPDTSAVDISSRLDTIDQILEVTTKPMIVDADNGGLTEHFCFTVRTMERLGVSAVIIEDKVGAKRNSLFGADVHQAQDSIKDFCHKISQGKKAKLTPDFMIIARIESLILKIGMADALERAEAYVSAGADGIMIHSNQKKPDEVLEFCKIFREKYPDVPTVVVPTTYAEITEDQLAEAGVKIVIYANHLIRSAFPAMVNTARSILENGRALEADKLCMPIKEILTLIPESL